jgi:hypothetical protein
MTDTSTTQNSPTQDAQNTAAQTQSSDSTDAINRVSTVDVQAQITAALDKQKAEFATQLEQATGHKDLSALAEAKLKSEGKLQELADNKAAEAASYKTRFEQAQINNQLLSAASEALDSDVVMALLRDKASVDANGNVLVDGKSAKDAVADLLKAKPHLAKATGATGSGAPNSQTQQSTESAYAEAAKNHDVMGMLNANTGVSK